MASNAGDHSETPQPSPLTWIGSDRRLARRIGRPMLRFLRIEAASGALMLVAAVVALVWANSPWRDSYLDLLHSHIRFELGGVLVLDEPLEAWINDALMVVFFFVVGLEIKRELVVGELRRPRAAALPAVAAMGGMIVPALIYIAFNAGGEGAAGWGIPMATDIAFAVGVLSLLGRRVSNSLKIFLLTLAIVDDIGAIAVIAVFYTDDLSLDWLLVSVLIVVLVALMRLARIWYVPAYLIVGVVLWLAVFESGVHATIAGVILGIITPARPLVSDTTFDGMVSRWFEGGSVSPPVARRASFEVRERVSVADRLANLLHPWTSFVIVPIFALANAGVELSSDSVEAALRSPVTVGIVLGLVLGKLVGVGSFTWLAVRLGLCELPSGANWAKVLGIGGVAGIGFTVSLFITNLAFESPDITDQAKIGILVASTIAALIGAGIIRSSRSADPAATAR
jgi:NhaA family Na+:H+ antiporter